MMFPIIKIPGMLSNLKSKQKHHIIVDKFFEKYLQEVHTEKDVCLLHGVLSSKDLSNEKQSSYLINSKQTAANNQSKMFTDNPESIDYSKQPMLPEESKEELIGKNHEDHSFRKQMETHLPLEKSVKEIIESIYEEDDEVYVKKNNRMSKVNPKKMTVYKKT